MTKALLDCWQFDRSEPVAAFRWPDSRIELLCRFSASLGVATRLACQDPDRDTVVITSATPGGAVAELGGVRTRIGACGRTQLTYVPAGMALSLDYHDFAPPLIALALPRGEAERLAQGPVPQGPLVLHPAEREGEQALRLACIIMRGWEQDSRAVAVLTGRLIDDIANLAVADPVAERASIAPRRLAAVLAFIETNLARPVSVGDLAGEANLSPFHFTRAFKQDTGQTPYGYLQRRRILRAIGMLGETRLAISEIAGLCGFTNPARFSYTFSVWTGQSASRLRQRLSAVAQPVPAQLAVAAQPVGRAVASSCANRG